ncbi:MAG: efflux RND transporter permease subunit [Acidimicrobiales bacterium]
MNLTRLLIRRPLLTAMPFVAIGLLGIVALSQLPVNSLPNINFPAVTVRITDPGASSTTIEQSVTKPVEAAVNAVGGISQLTGTSAQGLSQVVAQFSSGTSVTAAANQVSQAVGRIESRLPPNVSPPSILQVNPLARPIMTVVLSGGSNENLYQVATQTLQPQLQLVSGVGQVVVNGGVPVQANVVLNTGLLEARGITVPQVNQAIDAQDVAVPAGTTTGSPPSNGGAGTGGNGAAGGTGNVVQVGQQATNASQLARVVVGQNGNGVVRLGEVASVSVGPGQATTTATLNGRPTVAVDITAQANANALSTDSAVRSALTSLDKTLPPGTHAKIVADTTSFIRASLSATEEDLILAILLASLVILFFLQSPRQTLIVIVAIPTSLLATMLMMDVFGFSLDLISLLALSLLIGILVDDSVVVIENITRHLHLGSAPEDAAFDGRMEIGAAAVALTLTDVVIFSPMAFAGGTVGQVLLEFGGTIVVASLFSLLVGFTLTPMLAARWLRPPGPREHRTRLAMVLERGIASLGAAYARGLRRSLGHRRVVLAVAGSTVVISVLLVTTGMLGSTFVPTADVGQVAATVIMPPGSTLAATDNALTSLTSLIRSNISGVTNVYATAGGVGGVKSSGSGQLTIDLVAKTRRQQSASVIATRVTELAQRVPGIRVQASVPGPFTGPGSSGLQVILRGPDLPVLQQLAGQAQAKLAPLSQLSQVQDTAGLAAPSWDVRVNQVAARSYGLSATGIGQSVAAAVGGTVLPATVQAPSGVNLPVDVTVAGGSTTSLSQLLALPVGQASPTVAGLAPAGTTTTGGTTGGTAASSSSKPAAPGYPVPAPVTLGEVATVSHTSAPVVIEDYGQLPQVTVLTVPANGVPLSAAKAAVTRALASLHMPSGYDILYGGQAKAQSTAFGPLLVSLALAPLLIYLLLAALYESLVLPFAVLLSLPLAIMGAFLALVASQQTLNMFSMIGLLFLMGLVSKNAILLVDYTETLRGRGRSRVEALVEAGSARLRPILMTTVTVVVASMPIAFSATSGSEYRSPMALVLIGGLSSSTLFTLFFVPTLYTYLDSVRQRWWRRKGGAPKRWGPGGGGDQTTGSLPIAEPAQNGNGAGLDHLRVEVGVARGGHYMTDGGAGAVRPAP